MSSVKVKICGLTRSQDVDAAVEAGADAIGFVFASSPRQLSVDTAAELTAHVPAGVLRVGLFMGQSRGDIRSVLARVSLDLLQFHGPLDNAFCRSFGMPFIKAISVASSRAVSAARRYPDATGILFDSPAPGGAGGTGKTFDWSLLDTSVTDVWLAGGLNAENVGLAVAAVRPAWVDVSSGVEEVPGRKNHAMMRAFVQAAKAVPA